MPQDDDKGRVVGHKTFSVPGGGFRHEPLYESEAAAILAAAEAEERWRTETMPDEKAAVRMLFAAYLRLKALGWNDAIYCPKDGREFEVIEVGSTGVHRAHYLGEWPNGGWWVSDEHDLYPSRPVLFRAIRAPAKPEGSPNANTA